MDQDQSRNQFGDIVSKCWKDAAFKQKFMSNPKGVLKDHGIDVPAGMDVKVVENSDKVLYVTIPPAPPAPGELSEKELESAAGGALYLTYRRIQTLLCYSIQGTCTGGKECVPW
jgi:nitrile hydratase alpha subunit